MNKFKEEDEGGLFIRNGRAYVNPSHCIDWMQKQIDDNDIIVMATKKYQIFPVDEEEYFVTNYGCDRRPYNQYGNIRGQLVVDRSKYKNIIFKS